jgi:hypothetical protein
MWQSEVIMNKIVEVFRLTIYKKKQFVSSEQIGIATDGDVPVEQIKISYSLRKRIKIPFLNKLTTLCTKLNNVHVVIIMCVNKNT